MASVATRSSKEGRSPSRPFHTMLGKEKGRQACRRRAGGRAGSAPPTEPHSAHPPHLGAQRQAHELAEELEHGRGEGRAQARVGHERVRVDLVALESVGACRRGAGAPSGHIRERCSQPQRRLCRHAHLTSSSKRSEKRSSIMRWRPSRYTPPASMPLSPSKFTSKTCSHRGREARGGGKEQQGHFPRPARTFSWPSSRTTRSAVVGTARSCW